MSTREKIDTVYDFTEHGLVELKSWLEPWFLDRDGSGDECGCCPEAASDYSETVISISDLYAYWRLGETGSPWADTSGFGTAADLTLTAGSGAPITPDVTGALSAGDDGAVQFNYDGTTLASGSFLGYSGGAKLFKNGPGGSLAAGFTVACWARVKTSVLSREGLIIGNASTALSIPYSRYGWGLEVVYPSRKIRFADNDVYVETTAGVAADTWVFLVGVYDGSGGISLYMDGVLIGSQTGAAGSAATQIRIGDGTRPTGPSTFEETFFYGSIDEAAIWSHALTPEEITTLYESGAGGVGNGEVFTANGDGTCVWAYPQLFSNNAYVTVQPGPPDSYVSPLVFDSTPSTGGLYGWDGSAYVQVGPAL